MKGQRDCRRLRLRLSTRKDKLNTRLDGLASGTFHLKTRSSQWQANSPVVSQRPASPWQPVEVAQKQELPQEEPQKKEESHLRVHINVHHWWSFIQSVRPQVKKWLVCVLLHCCPMGSAFAFQNKNQNQTRLPSSLIVADTTVLHVNALSFAVSVTVHFQDWGCFETGRNTLKRC